MSGEVSTEPTRRRLTPRQADTVRRLTDAAVEEVRDTGYEGLTVRNVARRAGVAPATAYTYFASKNHMITEVFWRRLSALAPLEPGGDAAGRVERVLREIALLVSDEPELAAACTTAMLGTDPDVRELRARIGVAIRTRLRDALGGHGDPAVLGALELAYSGALLHAGMGYTSYARMADRLAEMARLILPAGGRETAR
ncbi:TetR/AcrR family transcriptional regulator [Actinomadura verrucosospora]|uniref:TetR family transcriptional regulator n=1 Tax=Actinomadura verrucosospora TaxID=46165 RepID=A0A7D3VYJ0_ACTVE|nr:TetR/AcrR family transcriptional regulator [Actinomadura verrucosospora]QKG25990.1 TetR family transcriptional regulator [Actinomadura verrucosospora]